METDTSAPPSPRCCDNGWTLVERPAAAEGVHELADPGDTLRTTTLNAEASGGQNAEQDEAQDGTKSPESEILADHVLREPFQAGGHIQLPRLSVSAPGAASTPAVTEKPSTPIDTQGPSSCGGGGLTHPSLHDPHHTHPAADLALVVAAAAVAEISTGSGCCGGQQPGHEAASGSSSSSGGEGSWGGCGWGFEPHRERERLRAACRLSGEGALEGFQDPQDPPLAAAAPATTGAGQNNGRGQQGQGAASSDDSLGLAAFGAGVLSSRGSSGPSQGPPSASGSGSESGSDDASLSLDVLVTSLWADLVRELEEMRTAVVTTGAALWERVADGRMAVEEWAAAVRAATYQAFKTVCHTSCPLWSLLGMGGLAAAALAALATQMVVSRRVAVQLSAEISTCDLRLKGLLASIIRLKEAMDSSARSAHGVMVPAQPYTTHVTLMGMA